VKKNKKFIDPRYFMNEKTNDLYEISEALEDYPGWDFLKPGRDPAQAFRDHVADAQGVEPKKARSGEEIAADLGYEETPLDPLEQLTAGDKDGDKDMLQAFAEILELTGKSRRDLADELHRLAAVVESDPNITSDEKI